MSTNIHNLLELAAIALAKPMTEIRVKKGFSVIDGANVKRQCTVLDCAQGSDDGCCCFRHLPAKLP